jgi:hypothetical protein
MAITANRLGVRSHEWRSMSTHGAGCDRRQRLKINFGEIREHGGASGRGHLASPPEFSGSSAVNDLWLFSGGLAN